MTPQEKFEEIKNSKEITITCADAAEVLSKQAQNIRNQAQTDPTKLGFNVIVVGSTVQIPRKPFIEYLGG